VVDVEGFEESGMIICNKENYKIFIYLLNND